MKTLEFKKHLMSNALDNFYIFVGEEIGIINIYIEQMSKVLNMPVVREDSVSSALLKSNSSTLFGSVGAIYVIRDDKDFMKNEHVFDKVKHLKNSYIILLCDKLDTRLKFAKYFKENTVEFEKLSHDVLATYIYRSCALKDKQVEKLIDCCGGNYDIAMSECNKIKTYAEALNLSEDKAFNELLFDGYISKNSEYSVFMLTNAVCSMQYSDSFKILHELLNSGMSSIVILGTLYKSFKAIMLIQVCESKDIANTTGLDNGQIYYNRKYTKYFDTDTLLYALDLIFNIVTEIKTGGIDDVIASDYALNLIFNKGRR